MLSGFCHYYNEAKKRLDVTLRQFHKAGEKVFTDYAGDTATIIDPKTGLKTPVYLFVATLGASSYTYAEGVLNMSLPSWIDPESFRDSSAECPRLSSPTTLKPPLSNPIDTSLI